MLLLLYDLLPLLHETLMKNDNDDGEHYGVGEDDN